MAQDGLDRVGAGMLAVVADIPFADPEIESAVAGVGLAGKPVGANGRQCRQEPVIVGHAVIVRLSLDQADHAETGGRDVLELIERLVSAPLAGVEPGQAVPRAQGLEAQFTGAREMGCGPVQVTATVHQQGGQPVMRRAIVRGLPQHGSEAHYRVRGAPLGGRGIGPGPQGFQVASRPGSRESEQHQTQQLNTHDMSSSIGTGLILAHSGP